MTCSGWTRSTRDREGQARVRETRGAPNRPRASRMFPAEGSGEKALDEKVAPGVVKRKAKGERKAGPFKVIDGGLAPGPYKAAKTEEVGWTRSRGR